MRLAYVQRFENGMQHRREGRANLKIAARMLNDADDADGEGDAVADDDPWQVHANSVWQAGCTVYPLAQPVLASYRRLFCKQGIRTLYESAGKVSPLKSAMLPADEAAMPKVPAFDAAAFARRYATSGRITCRELYGPGLCRQHDAALLPSVF